MVAGMKKQWKHLSNNDYLLTSVVNTFLRKEWTPFASLNVDQFQSLYALMKKKNEQEVAYLFLLYIIKYDHSNSVFTYSDAWQVWKHMDVPVKMDMVKKAPLYRIYKVVLNLWDALNKSIIWDVINYDMDHDREILRAIMKYGESYVNVAYEIFNKRKNDVELFDMVMKSLNTYPLERFIEVMVYYQRKETIDNSKWCGTAYEALISNHMLNYRHTFNSIASGLKMTKDNMIEVFQRSLEHIQKQGIEYVNSINFLDRMMNSKTVKALFEPDEYTEMRNSILKKIKHGTMIKQTNITDFF
jgi:hypothetical protein